jgi:hypothetical protein
MFNDPQGRFALRSSYIRWLYLTRYASEKCLKISPIESIPSHQASYPSLQSAFDVFNATISPVWRRIVFVEECNKAGYRPLTAGIIKHVRKPNE